jgi:secreted trypsin-like serine protease
VSIDLNGSPLCGGIIVTSRHVFTAAHCVTDKNGGPDAEPGDVQVRVGTVVVTQGDVYNVSKILVHPKFQKAGRHLAIEVVLKHMSITVEFLFTSKYWE